MGETFAGINSSIDAAARSLANTFGNDYAKLNGTAQARWRDLAQVAIDAYQRDIYRIREESVSERDRGWLEKIQALRADIAAHQDKHSTALRTMAARLTRERRIAAQERAWADRYRAERDLVIEEMRAAAKVYNRSASDLVRERDALRVEVERLSRG